MFALGNKERLPKVKNQFRNYLKKLLLGHVPFEIATENLVGFKDLIHFIV